MGISVTAFAATRPAGTSMDEANECPTHQGAPGVMHFYSLGTTFEFNNEFCVEGYAYGLEEDVVRFLESTKISIGTTSTSAFPNGYSEGWYYLGDNDSLYPCVEPAAETFDSVDIDLSSVRAGATLLDIYSSVINSISTDPVDTIDIYNMNLTHGSSDSELLLPTDPLEKGKTYTLWLTLQSAGVLFKQDSVSDYALSNLNIDAAYKNVFLDDGYDPADEGKILDMEIRFTVDSSTPGPGPNPDPKPAFDSVSIDFNNSNVAGATWNSIKSKITITTDPTGSIKIIEDNSGITTEGQERPIDPTTPLVEGKTYTLWLALKSTGCEFEADDASGEPAKNVALQNVEKTSESCSVMTESYDPAEKGKVLSIKIVFTAKSSSTPGPKPGPKPAPDPKPDPKPGPDPKPAPKREPESKGMDAGYMAYLMSQIKTDDAKKKVPAKAEPDRDTFKSEAPAKTVVAADAVGAASFLDLKVHGVDEKTSVNQKFLAQNLVSPSVNILLTENIYPRRELGMAEDGAAKTLSWNNLPKDQAGPVFAVVYNQKDGAYVLNGTLGANGTATFQGFKLRPASTITICK